MKCLLRQLNDDRTSFLSTYQEGTSEQSAPALSQRAYVQMDDLICVNIHPRLNFPTVRARFQAAFLLGEE